MAKTAQVIVTEGTLKTINEVLSELNLLRRWTAISTEGKYTELAKQALNCAIAYIWAIEVQNLGIPVDFNNFPKIALFRSFQKTIQCDIHEGIIDDICKFGVDRAAFDSMTTDKILSQTSEEFQRFITVDPNCIEQKIYKAATKLATLQELEALRFNMSLATYTKTREEIFTSLRKFNLLPGYDIMTYTKDYLDIFEDFSSLRNLVRWAKRPNILKCNVLGHLFDTAIFAYLMSLEVWPEKQVLASKYFFMGIFHDFPETYTGDMPSPIKDLIPNLREATEKYEMKMMKENVYKKMPKYQVKALKNVMLENKSNKNLKAFLKKADNFGACVECWRQILAGARDHYFFDVIKKDHDNKDSIPPNFQALLEDLFCDQTNFYR